MDQSPQIETPTLQQRKAPSDANFFKFIDLAGKAPAEARRGMRLNCLGSLYYFTKAGLQRTKLTDSLHFPICLSLERDHIKDVYELPRGHFKSTICSESLPMWWALPLIQQDLDDFAQLGYSDEFIEYMKRVHDADTRIALISENITNASVLGSKIRWHFDSNAIYRMLFPETLPTTSETWTNTSLHVKRPAGRSSGAHGEGTFDFLGVGSALQSRHYKKVVQDDLVGRKAIESPSVMDKTIDYHRLLPGGFESPDKLHENDELVVGNRWSYSDLNSYIRENEDWFRISSHSAMGGCCVLHPSDTPIFPEEFSSKKLIKLKKRFGSYYFSCQYLNNPSAPEDADFKEQWLRYFVLEQDSVGRDLIKHSARAEEVDEYGQRLVVRKNLLCNFLSIGMATDPAHAGNANARRCRHAIVVVGISNNGDYYLLDSWAQATTYDNYTKEIYRMARRWGLREFGLETVAAQKYLKFHLEYRNRIEERKLNIVELEGEVEAPDGTMVKKKEFRIRAIIEPIAQTGRLWIQRKHQAFITEYINFPNGQFVDLLDAFAYINQVVRVPRSYEEDRSWKQRNLRQLQSIRQPYSLRLM